MNVEHITSPHNPRYRNALKLHTARGRQKQSRVLVIGRREVKRAIQAGLSFEELMFDAGATLSDPETPQMFSQSQTCRSKTRKTRLSKLESDLFKKLTYGDREEEVIGIAARPRTDLEGLNDKEIIEKQGSLILVVESLEKPGNLGAIARSADATGTDAILVADPLTDIYHPNAIRASVATVFSIPIACGTAPEIQNWLAARDYQTFYATPEAPLSMYHADLSGRIAMVIGNEARGLSNAWRSGSALGVHLPMLGTGDSLNASVTASLIMYEALRQRMVRD